MGDSDSGKKIARFHPYNYGRQVRPLLLKGFYISYKLYVDRYKHSSL